jgi:hypothetical protein
MPRNNGAVPPDVPSNAKVCALTAIDGGTLREWRGSRGRDVPKTARELRRAASEPVAAPDALVRMIRGWERGDHELSERYELLYRRLGLETAQADAPEPEPYSAPDDASSVTAWVATTNTTDDAIEEMDCAATYLAEIHAQIPARKVLGEALALNRDVHILLRSGRQRLRQTPRLLQIHSRLMVHACVLLGDLGRAEAARDYGAAALLLAQKPEPTRQSPRASRPRPPGGRAVSSKRPNSPGTASRSAARRRPTMTSSSLRHSWGKSDFIRFPPRTACDAPPDPGFRVRRGRGGLVAEHEGSEKPDRERSAKGPR